MFLNKRRMSLCTHITQVNYLGKKKVEQIFVSKIKKKGFQGK